MGAFARVVAAALVTCAFGMKTKGFFSVYTDVRTERECSCSCCMRVQRRPAEVNGNVQYKCASPPPNDSRAQQRGCGARCMVVNDPVFPDASTLDSNRFCFHHCQPTSGGVVNPRAAAVANQQTESLLNGGSLLDAECVSIDLQQAVSIDRNGRDPMVAAAP